MSGNGSAPTKLQQLYEAGKAAFGGGRKAQPADLDRLKQIMGVHTTLPPELQFHVPSTYLSLRGVLNDMWLRSWPSAVRGGTAASE